MSATETTVSQAKLDAPTTEPAKKPELRVVPRVKTDPSRDALLTAPGGALRAFLAQVFQR